MSYSTHTLLRFGWWVGPFYLFIGLAQALTREGFDLGRHSLSVLANGPWGWVQTANLALSGAMVVATAVGIRRALGGNSRFSEWFLGAFGVSMLAAAVFRADPVDGFPSGTPEGMPETISTSGMVHFVAGGLGFLALALSAIMVAAVFSRRKESAMAWISYLSGVSIVAGFLAPALAPSIGPVAGIWFSVVVGWTWLALVCRHLSRSLPPSAAMGSGPAS